VHQHRLTAGATLNWSDHSEPISVVVHALVT
jgi:hypothetical protein